MPHYLILDGAKWAVPAADAHQVIAQVSHLMREGLVDVVRLGSPDDPTDYLDVTVNGNAIGTAALAEFDD